MESKDPRVFFCASSEASRGLRIYHYLQSFYSPQAVQDFFGEQ